MKNPFKYYQYHPLPAGSIRLIKLHYTGPKTTSDRLSVPPYPLEQQIVISLETYDRKKCPPYIALSYTWGLPGTFADPQPSVFTQVERVYPFYCNHTIILGTWNLRSALRHIRQLMEFQDNSSDIKSYLVRETRGALDGTHHLWVDAICINQNDLDERAVQVQVMGKIYSQAHRTLVWLGEPDEYTPVSFKALERVAQNINHAKRNVSQAGIPCSVEPVILDDLEMKACIALFNRKWFQRSWITQEVALSKNIWTMIGGQLFSFQIFERARTLVQLTSYPTSVYHAKIDFGTVDLSAYINRAFHNIRFLGFLDTSRDMMQRGQLPSFASVITMCARQECFDPRDKIYSVLSMCVELNGPFAGGILPNYTDDIEEVYLQATGTIIQIRRDLLILNLVSEYTQEQKLPSWCPDYRLIPPRTNMTPKVWKFDARPAPITQVIGSYLNVSGQCIGRMKGHARYHAPEGVSWNSIGLTQIFSLLGQLQTETGSDFRQDL